MLITGGNGFFGKNITVANAERTDKKPVGQHRELLYMARGWCPEVLCQHFERAVFTSSGAVFGHGEPIYARMKREQEALFGSMGFTIARCWTHYGPHMHRESALGQFIEHALTFKRITVHSPDTVRSYQHIRDTTNRLLELLYARMQIGVQDVGSREPITMLDLANKVARITGASVHVYRGSSDFPTTYYVPSHGVGDTIKFDEGLEETIAWARENWLPSGLR